MIKVLFNSSTGQYVPIFACDVCGERIERAGDGTTLSPMVPPAAGLSADENEALSETGDPDAYEVFHVHKGDCMVTMERKYANPGTAGDGLVEHVYYLARNLGLTLDDLRNIESGDD